MERTLEIFIAQTGDPRGPEHDYISAAYTYSLHTFSDANTSEYTLILLHTETMFPK